jgi:hypothetical protein
MNAKWFPFGKFLEYVVNLMLSNILTHYFFELQFFPPIFEHPCNLWANKHGVCNSSWMHSDYNSPSCFESSFCLDLSTLSNYLEYDLGENRSCKFFMGLLICFRTCWPLGFTRHFLRAISCFVTLLTLSLEFFKRWLFSFSFFYYVNGIVFVTTKWLHLDFDNGSNFALYSKTSPFLQRWHLQLCFSMAGITWGLIDSHHHPSFSHNPSSYAHSTSF